MKKIIFLFLILGLLQYTCFAQDSSNNEDEEIARIKDEISRVQKEIERLETKLSEVSSEERITKIKSLLAGHKVRLEKLKNEIVEIEKLKIKEVATEEAEEFLEEVPEATEEVYVEPERIEVEKKKRYRFLEFEIGAMAGVFGSSMAGFGELRFSLPFIFRPATTSLRIAGGLAQSEDAKRKYAPIHIDWILNFPEGWFTGVDNYLGAGLNYVVLTTGKVPGTFGGQVFYGVESKGFGGKLFGEMGYGILQTGFGPYHSGATILIGYRTNWGI